MKRIVFLTLLAAVVSACRESRATVEDPVINFGRAEHYHEESERLYPANTSVKTQPTKYNSPPQTTYHYQDVKGMSMFYREAGDKNRPTIVLLHAFPSSFDMYANLISILATEYHVIAPDNVGSGFSDRLNPNNAQYTFDTLAYFTNTLLDSIGVENYVMCMHDFAAPVGYRMYVKQPNRITHLIVQNASASLEELTVNTQMLLKSNETVIDKQYLFDIDSTMRRWQELLRNNQPKTLIVCGEKGRSFISGRGKVYLGDLPNTKVSLFNAGHFAVEEKAREIAMFILNFLKNK
jgi:pimeloyl-ACP methyl ester carboxylesterase